MADDMPGDLLHEILTLLPVKSLMRFQCVCQSWKLLIKSPEFVADHLSFAISNKTQHHVILSALNFTKKGNVDQVLSWLSYDAEAGMYNWMLIEKGIVSSHIGDLDHCDGIICLATGKHVVLMNPGIRQSRTLPETCIRSSDKYPKPHYSKYSVGFGYDPKIRDYKVIRIWRSPTYDHVRIEVYTISTNTWREIDTIDEYFAKHFFWGLDVKRCLNRYFYWLGGEKYKDNGNNMKYVVSSFNISNEVFQKISTPDNFLPHRSHYNDLFSDHCHYDNDLLILKGSLALVEHHKYPNENFLKIWMMNGHGEREFWTQASTIWLFPNVRMRPLLFWKDDEILVRRYKGNAYVVASYNIGTQQIDDILNFAESSNSADVCYCVGAALTYVYSLVSVWGNNS